MLNMIITPEEFWLKMCTIITKNDGYEETTHIEMDNLMCDLLCELGYKKGIEVFKHTSKWYS